MKTNAKIQADKRIADAVRILNRRDTGRRVLARFKQFADADVQELDMSEQSAVVTLLRELTFGQRSDFLHKLIKGDSNAVNEVTRKTTRTAETLRGLLPQAS